VKKNLPMQFVENVWFKHMVVHLCPNFNFRLGKKFSQENLSNLVDKINQLYFQLTLAKCDSTIVIFDVWMSKGAHDIFTLVSNILRMD
jgi:hypothetical protein